MDTKRTYTRKINKNEKKFPVSISISQKDQNELRKRAKEMNVSVSSYISYMLKGN